ncbi:DUF4333 domain-containing protein [Pseudonocardia spinosispora]|uniref:DUF4333 domain-containing protein n=1 Tax=Pseudonocardia spinosispora TaxID=103441 RepID=UPI001B7FB749|nr:DUF4333 domain-containing protein [Pseudonocardia spinosispora]
MGIMRTLVATGLAVGLILSTGACSVRVWADTGPSVDKDIVAQQISAQLAAKIGRAPERVSCPENLPVKLGAHVRCTLTDGGQNLGVTVTVDQVQGTYSHFVFAVDEHAMP